MTAMQRKDKDEEPTSDDYKGRFLEFVKRNSLRFYKNKLISARFAGKFRHGCNLPAGDSLLRFTDAEKPPSIALAPVAGMPVKINLQHAVIGGGDLEPVFADIELGAAMAAFSGFTPCAQNRGNL
jgi:hypothetical protein